MSIPSELGHLAMPTNFLAQGKHQMAQASFERTSLLRSAAEHHWLGVSWRRQKPYGTYSCRLYGSRAPPVYKRRLRTGGCRL